MSNQESEKGRPVGGEMDKDAAMESDVEGHRAGHMPADERARAGHEPAEQLAASDDDGPDVEAHRGGFDPKERGGFESRERGGFDPKERGGI
jgi:hypothetical protein